jgi:hypothetical protein
VGPRAGLDLFHRWGNAHGAVFQLHGCRAAHGVIDLGTSNARNVAVWSVQQTGENAMINRLTASIGKYVKMWETLWKIYYLVGEIKEIWAITMEIYVPKRVNSYSWEHIWTCCISTHFRGDMCFFVDVTWMSNWTWMTPKTLGLPMKSYGSYRNYPEWVAVVF